MIGFKVSTWAVSDPSGHEKRTRDNSRTKSMFGRIDHIAPIATAIKHPSCANGRCEVFDLASMAHPMV